MIATSVLIAFALQGKDLTTRFQPKVILPGLPSIMLDQALVYDGPAKQVCTKYGLEGRTLWIDATANIERYNSEPKIEALVARIKRSGFNTIVFDVKPLSGEMVYPSEFAPKLLEWKGKELGQFDPLGPMCREARIQGLSFFVSMNAFCDGHRLVNRGPGFNRPEEQSVVYEPSPVVRVGSQTLPVVTNATDAGVQITATIPPAPTPVPPPITNDGTTPPPSEPQKVIVVCNKFGVIQDTNSATPPVVPKGGFVLSANGEVGMKLTEYALVGATVLLDSVAEYKRIGLSSDKQYPLMTSPTNPVVRRRLLDIAKEVVNKYDIDGIIYDDRLRYTGLNGDFSPLTRALFEQAVGAKLNWPDDVFKYTYAYSGGLNRGIRPGRYYDRWMAWRAGILRNFTRDARATIRAIKPSMKLGVYAGSWYGEYQQYGNNWAAPSAEAGFWFMTPQYRETGFANDIDLLYTGCYYPNATIFDALGEGKGIGATVESAGYLSYRAVRDETFVYAGLSLADFKDNPAGLNNALQAAVATTNGVMVFDLSHDIEPMWPVFEKAFSVKKIAPHKDVRYITEARRLRALRDRREVKDPPIVIAAGSAGIGF